MKKTLMVVLLLLVPIKSWAADASPTDAQVVVADAGDKDAAVPAEATDVKGAAAQAKDAVKAAKEGRWWYFSALVLMVLMFVVKFIGLKVGFWKKLGRWRYIIVPVVSLAAALLAAFQGGVSIDTAFGVFTSSYATASLQELWEHGIMNKPRASA